VKQTEYLIIGAGIVGCTTAYFLTKQNKKVMVVDRTYPCNEASGVNAGGLELLQQPPKSLPLHIEAAELWDKFQNEYGVDVGYERTGGLFVILREEDLHMLDEQEKRFNEYGLKVNRLTKNQVVNMIPHVASEHVLAANYSPMSGYSNPLKAGRNILEAAKDNGAEFVGQQLITRIEPAANGKGYDVYSENEVFHAEKVLVACGIRSPKLLDPLGVHIELQRQHNMITVTEKAPHFLDYTFTTPTLTMKQTAEGSILIGGGREGYGDLEKNRKDVSINNLCFNVREAQEIIPSIKKLNILRSWSGFEGFTTDRLPRMSEAKDYPGIYYAVTGFCGYAIGPGVGMQASRMMTEKE
jgi:sarcosine oxidase subunit beta